MTQRPFDQTLAQTLKALRPAPDNRDAWSHEGRAYMGATTLASSTGEFSAMQLWNPPGNQFLLVVDSVLFVSTGGQECKVILVTDPLSNDVGGVVNVHAGMQQPSGKIQREHLASEPSEFLGIVRMGGNQPEGFDFVSPIILPAGYGLRGVGGVVNTILDATFQWRELDL